MNAEIRSMNLIVCVDYVSFYIALSRILWNGYASMDSWAGMLEAVPVIVFSTEMLISQIAQIFRQEQKAKEFPF